MLLTLVWHNLGVYEVEGWDLNINSITVDVNISQVFMSRIVIDVLDRRHAHVGLRLLALVHVFNFGRNR